MVQAAGGGRDAGGGTGTGGMAMRAPPTNGPSPLALLRSIHPYIHPLTTISFLVPGVLSSAQVGDQIHS